MRLAGKRALITGAARGIGLGIAHRFLEEGAQVVLLDRSEGELLIALETLKDYGEKLQVEICDLRDVSQLEQSVAQAFERFGGIDIVVNNAGIAFREHFLDISVEHWDAVFDINVRAVYLIGQLAARQMISQGGGGAIINMSSKMVYQQARSSRITMLLRLLLYC